MHGVQSKFGKNNHVKCRVQSNCGVQNKIGGVYRITLIFKPLYVIFKPLYAYNDEYILVRLYACINNICCHIDQTISIQMVIKLIQHKVRKYHSYFEYTTLSSDADALKVHMKEYLNYYNFKNTFQCFLPRPHIQHKVRKYVQRHVF